MTILFRSIGLLISSAVFLASCAEPQFEKLCGEGDQQRRCTQEELAFIADMHSIIASVRNYEANTSEVTWLTNFSPPPYGAPKVFIYGEEHTDIIGMIETLGKINAELKRNDIILFEGGDRSTPLIKDCGLERIFEICMQWQFEKLGRSYDESFGWNKLTHYRKLFASTRKSYDLTGLSIGLARCGYWDDGDAVMNCLKDRSQIFKYSTARNSSMVIAIKDRLKTFDRVIINTGYAHMPLGEFYASNLKNKKVFKGSRIQTLSDYYQLVEAEKLKPQAARQISLEHDAGSTKVVFDYLHDEKIPFVEAIHGKFLSNR